MKKLTELVKKCRQEIDPDLYGDYMEEARHLQAEIDTANTAINLFAGLPEGEQAKIRLKRAEAEVLSFRAKIYRLYNQI
jgi:hypothetical protein